MYKNALCKIFTNILYHLTYPSLGNPSIFCVSKSDDAYVCPQASVGAADVDSTAGVGGGSATRSTRQEAAASYSWTW